MKLFEVFLSLGNFKRCDIFCNDFLTINITPVLNGEIVYVGLNSDDFLRIYKSENNVKHLLDYTLNVSLLLSIYMKTDIFLI